MLPMRLPVSYTHLDVYKRQLLSSFLGALNEVFEQFRQTTVCLLYPSYWSDEEIAAQVPLPVTAITQQRRSEGSSPS